MVQSLHHVISMPSLRHEFHAVSGVKQRAAAFIQKNGWLKTITMIIGIVTIASVLGALFVGVGDTPGSVYTDESRTI